MASGRATSAPAPTNQASKTRTTTFTAAGLTTPVADLNSTTVAWGQAATIPSTYGGLAHPHQIRGANVDTLSINYDTGSVSLSIISPDVSDLVVGDRIWLLWFGTAGTAVSGSVPDVAVDLGLLAA